MKKNYTPISADDAKASWVAEFEGEEDDAADSDAGEDYELAG